MTEYLLTACSVVFLSVVVSFVIPEGKLGKTISVILRIACIVILISPLAKLFGVTDSSYSDLADYDYICTVFSENQGSALKEILSSEFGAECDCTVEITYSDGSFNAENVTVCLFNTNEGLADKIYEYLEECGYINITVYEQT